MAPRKPHIWDGSDEPEDDGPPTKSRSQKKRDANAVHALGEPLVALPETTLAALELPQELHQAIVACRGQKKNARQRQLRYIAKLLRGIDTTSIELQLATDAGQRLANAAVEQASEQWRARLIEEGDVALSALVDACPNLEVPQLRGLMRQARSGKEGARQVRARRDLLRSIRSGLLAQADAQADMPEDMRTDSQTNAQVEAAESD